MNAVPNFRELLAQPSDTFERPPALPKGHYIGTIKAHEFGQSKQKKTPFVRFLFTPEEATPDVEDQENLAKITLNERSLQKDFYITPASLWRLRQFLDGVLGSQEGRSFDERIPDTKNVRVQIEVGLRFSDDGEDQFNDVLNVVAA